MMIPSLKAHLHEVAWTQLSTSKLQKHSDNILAGMVDLRSDESSSVNSNLSTQSETVSPGVTRYFKVSITVILGQ